METLTKRVARALFDAVGNGPDGLPISEADLVFHSFEESAEAWEHLARAALIGAKPTYIELVSMGRAARAEIENQQAALKRAGQMAVQDSWDASPADAAWGAFVAQVTTPSPASE